MLDPAGAAKIAGAKSGPRSTAVDAGPLASTKAIGAPARLRSTVRGPADGISLACGPLVGTAGAPGPMTCCFVPPSRHDARAVRRAVTSLTVQRTDSRTSMVTGLGRGIRE